MIVLFREFTLKESFWFALTSFTPQGGGEAPKALSSRTLVAAYWLFVVLMLATFTANLAAFLTVERMQVAFSPLPILLLFVKLLKDPPNIVVSIFLRCRSSRIRITWDKKLKKKYFAYAIFISFITQSPVQSLEQLARQSRINYTVLANSSAHQYFINMKNAEDKLYT